MNPLLSPHRLGRIQLANRIAMAPMTRSRASRDGVPGPLAPTYYAQRASAGLIVTEATQASAGDGYYRSPGIYSRDQIAAWKAVVDAVHSAGGRIFLQLWHTGRTSHPDLLGGRSPVAPSQIACEGLVRVGDMERKPRVIPRALAAGEIAGIIEDFRRAAENADEAGFDGVEVHGANGYLLDQFTRDGSNRRGDIYGGGIEGRLRFPLEVTRAVIGVLGADRVGYRISPRNPFNTMSDSDPVATFAALAQALRELGIAYLHCVDPANEAGRLSPMLRKLFGGTYIVNGGFDFEAADRAIVSGEADLVSFAAAFLANPDLPDRYARHATLNEPDRSTYYTDGAKGYIDYPALAAGPPNNGNRPQIAKH